MKLLKRFEKSFLGTKNNFLNGLKLESRLSSGQQGVVYKLRNQFGRHFAIKLQHPEDKNPAILAMALKRFQREIKILSSFSHRNIVKVSSGGRAVYNAANGSWKFEEGPRCFQQTNQPTLYFYIMDFIAGKNASELFPTKPVSKEGRVRDFENMCLQMTEALAYAHKKNIAHGDIKPENIRYSSEDNSFVLVDFGFARPINGKYTTDKGVIINKRYQHFPAVLTGDLIANDISQLCSTFQSAFRTLRVHYDEERSEGLQYALQKGIQPTNGHQYRNADEVRDTLRQFLISTTGAALNVKLHEHLTASGFGLMDSRIRIPVSGTIYLTKEVRQIVDMPEFQRLRGVKQLGTTDFVFPGACHTRFEHSLGTYHLATRYLEALSRNRWFADHFDDGTARKLFLLAALLHDIGHYPFSHWIEEIDSLQTKFPHHEERARTIIYGSKLKDTLERVWEIDAKSLCDIIENKRIMGVKKLANSFINSPIDVDKLDYLIRDSVHCGVAYGKGIDVERLMDAIYIDAEKDQLCLTQKGRDVLSQVLVCRNMMYSQVYWHKTVRCTTSMFKRFFWEFVKEECDSLEHITKKTYLADYQFISYLYSRSASHPRLQQLIAPFVLRKGGKGRTLFKVPFVYEQHYESSGMQHNLGTFFYKLLAGVKSYDDLIDLTKRLVTSLRKKIPGITEYDVILDTTPTREGHERVMIEQMKSYNTKTKRPEDMPYGIAALDDFLMKNRQAYLFCHPRISKNLSELVNNGYLDTIVSDL